jgi:prolyl 4-hydroxylase
MFSPEQIRQIRTDAAAGQPEAQFLLSQIQQQNGDLDDMLHWLQKAAASGHPDALDALGYCYEQGRGVIRDYAAALENYESATERGSAFAAYHLAELLYKSRSGLDREARIRELLTRAAAGDCMPALRVLGYLALQPGGSRELADDCLRRAALLGDPVSDFNLAWHLVESEDDDTSRQEATLCLQRAASIDYPFATTMLASLEGVRPSSSVRPPARPLQVPDDLPIFPATAAADGQVVCPDPLIVVFGDVLDPVDCAYLMFLSRPYLKRADVIDPDSQRGGMVSEVRTSMSTFLPFTTVDFIGRHIELKIIGHTGQDLEKSEPMSILRYSPGQFYRPHFDYFDPKLKVSKGLMDEGGQRTFSAVTCLSAPEAGGGTSFPKLDITVPASAGGTVLFRNCLDDGQVDVRSLHAGDPVERGEKWVVTKWFREAPTIYLEL